MRHKTAIKSKRRIHIIYGEEIIESVSSTTEILKSIIYHKCCGNLNCYDCPMWADKWMCSDDARIVENAKKMLIDITLDEEFEEKI